MGDAAIVELKIVQGAANRLARGQVKKRPLLSSWSNVLDYCRTAMAFADKEQFRILFLDKRNQLIADEVQQTGTIDHTPLMSFYGVFRTDAFLIGARIRPISPARRSNHVAHLPLRSLPLRRSSPFRG